MGRAERMRLILVATLLATALAFPTPETRFEEVPPNDGTTTHDGGASVTDSMTTTPPGGKNGFDKQHNDEEHLLDCGFRTAMHVFHDKKAFNSLPNDSQKAISAAM